MLTLSRTELCFDDGENENARSALFYERGKVGLTWFEKLEDTRAVYIDRSGVVVVVYFEYPHVKSII